jgi:hypothetical protein
MGTTMAIALEPNETKYPGCSNSMAPARATKEERQTLQHLDYPDYGHHLEDPPGAWAPSGWAW